MKKMNRRDFLKTMTTGAIGIGVMAMLPGCVREQTQETQGSEETQNIPEKQETPYTFADTVKWDAEYDVAVLGMGFSGMVSALSAAREGASVVVLEKAMEEKAGGNSKVCGQLFARSTDLEHAVDYFTAMSAGKDDDPEVLRVMSQGIVDLAEKLEKTYGMDPTQFMDWSDTYLAFISPEYPELAGADGISIWSTHDGRNDAFLYKHIKGLIEEKTDVIDVWYESPAVDLIQDPITKTIVGVKVKRGDQELNVRALNGVCVCTGGFENNPAMVKTYLNRMDTRPYGGLYNTGDGIRMCQRAGCDLKNMQAYEGGFAFGSACWMTEQGTNAIGLSFGATGSCMVVGTDGQRLFNETEVVRHGHLYAGNLIWENPHFAEKNWAIFDQAHMDKISASIPAEYADQVKGFESYDAAAEYMGMSVDNLKGAIEKFNLFVNLGKDYEIGRDVATMSALTGEKLYVVRVLEGVLNTQGGPRRNANAEILDTYGNPIPHLYSAGEMGGITSMMYQGGVNVAECFTMGEIAGKNAAKAKDTLPNYQALAQVESTPSKVGEIDDIGASDSMDYPTEENQYIGKGEGFNGEVVVRITVDESKKIVNVEVLSHHETDGIGSKAIDALPQIFAGMSTKEEIDAVDGVSGASFSSRAMKAAVIDALAKVK